MKLAMRIFGLAVFITTFSATVSLASFAYYHQTTAGRVEQLIMVLDEKYDRLHPEYTPAVNELAKLGRPAIRPLLEVMLSDNEFSRLHANMALLRNIAYLQGLRDDHGWVGDERKNRLKFRKFWDRLGNLNHEAPLEERRAAVEKWHIWLDSGEPPE
ncbi:MAG: hypothetical protein SFX18_08595 [Pirellulales bacterium]|nr:hypothetical protein [Pirellulales bacterium]